jgi:hypothetical protein
MRYIGLAGKINKQRKYGAGLLFAALLLFLTASASNALIIEIENLTDIQQTGIDLEFDLPNTASPFFQYIDYDLFLGDIHVTPDVPEISLPGTILTGFSLLPSYMSGPRSDLLSDGLSVNLGSTGVWDRVRAAYGIVCGLPSIKIRKSYPNRPPFSSWEAASWGSGGSERTKAFKNSMIRSWMGPSPDGEGPFLVSVVSLWCNAFSVFREECLFSASSAPLR